ncbi:hypothetical protein PIB30_041704 [Stylosanthes scabra]|uniref:Transposase MuDR plant domain-containing protein n=1 Tax=Stylosanthes scabra TaxID=79078 RepID=A0ABU6VEM2_9FABA|nr:hypothetical protein [Stylosanthes scabra]
MDQPLIIRLYPNAVIHEQQDGVWFQSDSPTVFQHADISTMSELVEVFLYNQGGGFTEIRKVGYRFLQRQPNGRFVHLLEGGECGADTPAARCPRYILPAPPPIPRLEDVPCFFQQLDLDEGACVDPLKAGMGNDYNTNGGAEIQVIHRMRNQETVQTAVKNYSIRRNAEYMVIESERIKYHCRYKHAENGCPWSIRVALRQNLGYW